MKFPFSVFITLLVCSTALNVDLPPRSEVHAAVAMLNQIKTQVRGKAFAEITPELKGIIGEMITLTKSLFEYIKTEHDTTQKELDDLEGAANSSQSRSDAGKIDADKAHDEMTQCRFREVNKKKEVDVCHDELCVACNCTPPCNASRIFYWQIDEDQVRNCNDTCCLYCNLTKISKHMNPAYNPELQQPQDYIGWFHETRVCPAFSRICDEEARIEGEYRIFADKLLVLEEQCEVCEAGCANKTAECRRLRQEYRNLHHECNKKRDIFWEKGCSYGFYFGVTCQSWYDVSDFVAIVRSRGDNATKLDAYAAEGKNYTNRRVGISEADRLLEYEAVWEVICILEAYQEGGHLNDTHRALCRNHVIYAVKIGIMRYPVPRVTQCEITAVLFGTSNSIGTYFLDITPPDAMKDGVAPHTRATMYNLHATYKFPIRLPQPFPNRVFDFTEDPLFFCSRETFTFTVTVGVNKTCRNTTNVLSAVCPDPEVDFFSQYDVSTTKYNDGNFELCIERTLNGGNITTCTGDFWEEQTRNSWPMHVACFDVKRPIVE